MTNRQDTIIKEFENLSDWSAKYKYIIELGTKLPNLEDSYKTDEFLIKGCQSLVWLYSKMENGKVFFYADSNSKIVKGIIALLISVFSGLTINEINNCNLYFIDEIGLKSFLSPTRSNGIASMIKQIKSFRNKDENLKVSPH